MLASALISDTIPPLRTSDTGIKALNWMDEFKVSHLPIVNNHELLGVVSDTDILDLNAPEEPLGNHPLSLFRPFVYENEHIYEVLKLVAKMQLTIVPVLDAENNYLGNISLRSLVEHFADMTAVTNPGGVIILELNAHDFVLSQIARIVEENDAKILSLYIDEISDSTRLELTIKVNREDIRGILQSFARHNIPVKATFQQSEFSEDLRNRFDLFMNFINM
ncbi:MAG: CBS domain-containing protein [Bacteroidia bacterium]|jgi:acetoin utilization protein AcuB|nr:CBS domain-containing protein [Bacteroidia bacterium]